MNTGIYYDMDEHAYRQEPAVSQSELKVIGEWSEMHYKAGLDDDEEDVKESLLVGRVVATLALEPNRPPWWIVKPDGLRLNTTEGKQWKAANPGSILTYPQFQLASRMATALEDNKDPQVRDLLDGATREVSVFSETSTEFGLVRTKARPDLAPGGNVLADLKTCLDARPRSFSRSVERYRYDIQGASYLHQWNAARPPGDEVKEVFILMAIEKRPPYAVMLHRFDAEYLTYGMTCYLDLLTRYARARQTNEWPGYPSGINTLQLPKRYRSDLD